MKFSLNEMALLLGAVAPASAQTLPPGFGKIPPGVKPMQTFFIPLPEQSIFDDMFKKVNSVASSPVESLISFAISTDNTIIWYDHWEGGYELDPTKPMQKSTEIWGNGLAIDGCPPDIKPCTDAADKLKAGDSVVIQNSVPIPRNSQTNDGSTLYDGGDMVLASFPIAVTRGAYPYKPGSVMAGGVEVLPLDNWGKTFVAPVGEGLMLPGSTSQFMQTEFTGLFIMAAEDATEVTVNNNPNTKIYINKGKSTHVRVKMGDRITADKPVQIDLIAADLDSAYELRWFSLISVEQWSNDYVTPVGDSFGSTRCAVYNDNGTPLTVNMTMRANSTAALTSRMLTVPARGYTLSPVVPSGSGAQFKSVDDRNFVALSFTDAAVNSTDQAKWTGGQWFDWGFPLVPTRMLTPQVLIGWGYGCTNNTCLGQATRSVVWLSPVDDADFYIDYDNIGKNYTTRLGVNKLVGIKVSDPKDKDMSGALIFATKKGSGVNGTSVDFAAAWGQDPSVSEPMQSISLDLGTVVLPFSGIVVSKVTDKTIVGPGGTLTYTIRILNMGQVDIGVSQFSVVDPPQYDQIYVPGSTTYSIDGGFTRTPISDDSTGTPYPLDGTAGLKNPYKLLRRGGAHEIQFVVTVDPDKVNKTKIVNSGYLENVGGTKYPFSVETEIEIKASIEINNTVYPGHDGGASCNDSTIPVEYVKEISTSPVTYCFKVTNIGQNYLKAPYINNPVLKYESKDPGRILKPGDSYIVHVDGFIGTNLTKNLAQVAAQPVWASGSPIFAVGNSKGMDNVTDGDDSSVDVLPFLPNITIDNKVFKNDGSCNVSGTDATHGFLNFDDVTYCFRITNTGNTNLTDLVVTNSGLKPSYSNTNSAVLAPGESYLLTVTGKLDGNYSNTAVVVAKPVKADGKSGVSSNPSVTARDDSSITGEAPPPLSTRSGGKNPYDPPSGTDPDIVTECMIPHWRDGGGKQDLVCSSNDITIKSIYSNRAVCKEGDNVTVTATAELSFKKALYDPAWFVATDGGDARMGKCALKGLVAGNKYTVTDPTGSGTVVGTVAWNNDYIGGYDKCGDVLITSGSAVVTGSFLTSVTVKCEDANRDGSLDFAVCFSWREKAADSFCTLTNADPDTKGDLADVFPADHLKCLCTRVDLPTVSVDQKTSATAKVC